MQQSIYGKNVRVIYGSQIILNLVIYDIITNLINTHASAVMIC